MTERLAQRLSNMTYDSGLPRVEGDEAKQAVTGAVSGQHVDINANALLFPPSSSRSEVAIRLANMARYDDDDSDDSTRVSDRRRRRRARHRSPSESPSYSRRSYRGKDRTREDRSEAPEQDKLGNGSLAIGLITAIAGILQLWKAKKTAEREKEDRRRRRHNFESAKRERRKAEDTRARQRYQEDDEEPSPVRDMRRIGNAPSRSRSRSRAPRRIEAPRGDSRSPSTDSWDERDRGYESDRRTRQR